MTITEARTVAASTGVASRERPPEPGASRRRSWWIPLALSGGILGPALALAVATGSVLIAHNDDWGYRRPALLLFEHGRFALVGWAQVTLVAQLLWTWPFWLLSGHAPWAFAVSTLTVTVLGACALFALASSLVSRRAATAVVAVSLLIPGFALSATTYMTDVPSWSMTMICLWAGAKSLDGPTRRRAAWLAAALAAGLAGFGAREAVAAALAAVVAVASRRSIPGRQRRTLVALGAAAALAGAVLFELTRHMANVSPLVPGRLPALGVVDRSAISAAATFSLMLCPIAVRVALRLRRGELRRPIVACGGFVGLALALLAFGQSVGLASGRNGTGVFLGNYVQRLGVTGNFVLPGARAAAISTPAWDAVSLVSLASLVPLGLAIGAALDARLRTRSRAPRGAALLCGSYAVLYCAGLLAFLLAGQGLFDRYLFPLASVVAVLLETSVPPLPRSPGERGPRSAALRGALAVGLAAGVAATSLALTANADAFDAARWHAGARLVAAGLPPDTVDAGLEWVGMHQPGIATAGGPGLDAPDKTWYDDYFPAMRVCGVVASSPIDAPSYLEVDALRYPTWWVAGEAHLYLYRIAQRGCPTAR